MRTTNLDRLDNHVTVTVPTDADGYTDQECPEPACLGFFKILSGTGLPDVEDRGCPYCGHRGDPDTFYTPAQQEYFHATTSQVVADAFGKDVEDMFRGLGTVARGLVSMSVSTKRSRPEPIVYPHVPLPTRLVCSSCACDYKVAGAEGRCPDCGTPNEAA